MKIDHAFVTILVEHWRQETHKFHLPIGEATITLHDVALMFSQRIDELAVTGPPYYDWRAL